MRRILAAVLMTTLVIAACGGDGGGGGTAPTVAMTDFLYEPAEVTVPAGAAITLDLQNPGSLEHQWVILDAGVEVTSEDELPEETEIFAWESTYWGQQLDAGQGATFSFTAPAEGTYQIVCAIPGHLTAGMVGELTVTG
jgi:uncharacterized cupredoxin-like copper-binding protein